MDYFTISSKKVISLTIRPPFLTFLFLLLFASCSKNLETSVQDLTETKPEITNYFTNLSDEYALITQENKDKFHSDDHYIYLLEIWQNEFKEQYIDSLLLNKEKTIENNLNAVKDYLVFINKKYIALICNHPELSEYAGDIYHCLQYETYAAERSRSTRCDGDNPLDIETSVEGDNTAFYRNANEFIYLINNKISRYTTSCSSEHLLRLKLS